MSIVFGEEGIDGVDDVVGDGALEFFIGVDINVQ